MPLIGPDLIRKLLRENKDIRDSKLTGFVVRCRATGVHSYRVQVGRGRSITIGRVGKISPEAARVTAQTLLASMSRDTLKHLADDPTIALREAKARARSELTGPRANRRGTVRQFIETHYGPWVRENRKSGAETIDRLLSRFAEFESLALADLSAFAIERWRSVRLKSGVKPATVNRDFNALRAALSKAVEWRVLRVHPMAGVKQQRTDAAARVRYMSVDEESRLIGALNGRDDRRREERDRANAWRRERGYPEYPAFGRFTDHVTPIVLLALHTGCRRGELFGLRWRDVDLIGARLTVRGATSKAGQTRILPLNTEAASTLRAWKPADAVADAYVFPGEGDEPLTDIKAAWLPLVKAAKVEHFRFHDLRHTFASKLVQAGVDLNRVRALLGHSTPGLVLRYAHLSDADLAAAVAVLVR